CAERVAVLSGPPVAAVEIDAGAPGWATGSSPLSRQTTTGTATSASTTAIAMAARRSRAARSSGSEIIVRRWAGSARPSGAGDRHGGDPRDPYAGGGVRRVDDLTVADVDADMADGAVVEDQVARLQLRGGDRRRRAHLRARGVRK